MFLVKAVIFTTVLFMYLHLQHQFKKSNDLDILKINEPIFPTRDKLDELCNYRQPIVFYNSQTPPELLACFQIAALLENHATSDVQMRQVKTDDTTDKETTVFTQTTLKEAGLLWGKTYISERNASFLQETQLKRMMVRHDALLRPTMVVQCLYDLIMGAQYGATPIRYEINFRNYYLVTEGSVKIKFTVPNSSRCLQEQKDFENLEFRSRGGPEAETKVKWLEINLNQGELVYIPPYWWYSIEIVSAKACVCVYSYRTAMNVLAILPQLGQHFLQLRNITQVHTP